MTRRAWLLVVASSVTMLGWGTILPFQYAYAAQTRGWGAIVGAGAASLFSLGALVAAPIGGRFADRHNPVRVAVIAKVVGAAATLALVFAGDPLWFLAGMFLFGLGHAASVPAQSVLVLRWVGVSDRRHVFALQFTGSSVGMAIGAFGGGYLVDLSSPNGMVPAFVIAGVGLLASAMLIGLAGRPVRSDPARVPAPGEAGPGVGGSPLRTILRTPALRWLAVVTVALALGFYAQFESGLPAYALTVLGVSGRTVGTAAAVNCVVIVALQLAVVRWTRRRSGPSLLAIVGGIWVASWLVLALAAVLPAQSAVLFVAAFGVFALGETMYAPVLNPLAATLAPPHAVGSTLGLLAALQTGVSSAGPMVAGLLLATGHGATFVVLHVVISVVAVGAALRLRRLVRNGRGRQVEPSPASKPEAIAGAVGTIGEVSVIDRPKELAVRA